MYKDIYEKYKYLEKNDPEYNDDIKKHKKNIKLDNKNNHNEKEKEKSGCC